MMFFLVRKVGPLVSDERIQYIDIAKGIAMILIIAGHSVCAGYVQNAIYSFHVPLFFFVSGYFFKKRNFSDLVARNTKRLLVPYFVTCSLLVACNICKAIAGKGWGLVSDSIIAAFYCCGEYMDYGFVRIPSCGVLWFLPALFFAMLFLNVALKTKRPFAVIALVSLISWITGQYFLVPFGVQAGGFASLFLFAGFVERNELDVLSKIDQHKWVAMLLVLLWLPCFFFGSLFEMVIVSAPILPLNLIGAFCGIYVFLLFCKWIDSLNNSFRLLMTFFGQNTLIVLCVHLLDIRIFPWEKFPILENGHAETLVAFLIIFAIRLSIAAFAVWCQRKVRLLEAVF